MRARKRARTEDGEAERYTIGWESVKAYVNAIVDMYNVQKSLGQNPHAHPRGHLFKQFKDDYQRGIVRRRREQFEDRGKGTLLETYVGDEYKRLVRQCWLGYKDHKRLTPQSIESYLGSAPWRGHSRC